MSHRKPLASFPKLTRCVDETRRGFLEQGPNIEKLPVFTILWDILKLGPAALGKLVAEWKAYYRSRTLPGWMTTRRAKVGGFGGAALLLIVLGMGLQYWLWPPAPQSPVEKWFLPIDAAKQFVDAALVQAWEKDPDKDNSGSPAYQQIAQKLHKQLLAGELLARGNPQSATADEAPRRIDIHPAQWQTLRLGGPGFSSAPSSLGVGRGYANLEIGRPKARPAKSPP